MHFEGVEDEGLLKSLRERSCTELRKDESTPSVGLLRSRALRDRKEFIDALRSLAYYGATVEFEIRERQEPVQVVFRVTPGDIYPIRSVDVEVQPPAPELERSMPSPVQMGLNPGTPAKALGILDAGSAIARRARERGYPFASVGEPRVIADHLTQDAAVTLTLETGSFARFGDIAVVDLVSVERSYVYGKLPWKRGDPYNEALLDELRKRLSEPRLFSVIRVDRSSNWPMTTQRPTGAATWKAMSWCTGSWGRV